MNQDQVLGIVRTLIGSLGGYAIGRGWLNGEQVTLISGIAVAVVPAVWSYYAHTDSAKIASVTAMKDVAKVVIAPTAPSDSAAAAAAADTSQPKVTKS